jgi:hypothetical protein
MMDDQGRKWAHDFADGLEARLTDLKHELSHDQGKPDEVLQDIAIFVVGNINPDDNAPIQNRPAAGSL